MDFREVLHRSQDRAQGLYTSIRVRGLQGRSFHPLLLQTTRVTGIWTSTLICEPYSRRRTFHYKLIES